MRRKTFLLAFISICSVIASAQSRSTELKPAVPFVFDLSKNGTREFVLDLKKGDYAEFEWNNQLDGYWIETELLSPSGINILYGYGSSLIIPATGVYKFKVLLKGPDDAPAGKPQKLTLTYTNVLKIPPETTVRETRKINGYDVKIIVPKSEDGGESLVLIEKDGRPHGLLKGESFGTLGFNFADKGEGGDKSNALFAKTTDITGDGTPDVGIEYFSGGAHCCFEFYVFELGKEVKQIPPISGRDSSISAASANPKGGLILDTGDSTFAYWNVPFAGSPIQGVTLEFRDGSFHASPARMKRPAPAIAELQKQAAEAKAKINEVAYKGDSFAGITEEGGYVFEDAFWGTMLELIYTGHNDLAWKYFDMVWPAAKPGKEIFKKDFRTLLENSPYWEDIRPEKW